MWAGFPDDMKLNFIEPLKDLPGGVPAPWRRSGRAEGSCNGSRSLGLAWRCALSAKVARERLELLREADDIVLGEIKRAGLYTKIWQSFAVLLPVMSVGVMGDARTYAYTCAVRAVHSEDGMTADVAELPWEVLKRISTRIVNKVRGINRVVYDTTSKPPGTIRWEMILSCHAERVRARFARTSRSTPTLVHLSNRGPSTRAPKSGALAQDDIR